MFWRALFASLSNSGDWKTGRNTKIIVTNIIDHKINDLYLFIMQTEAINQVTIQRAKFYKLFSW